MPSTDKSLIGPNKQNPHNAPIGVDEFSSLMKGVGVGIDADTNPPSVAVGVSGGADSMALVLLVDRWAKSRGGSVLGITVDHCLREGSDREALQVASWLKERSIKHEIVKWKNGQGLYAGVQARAREARYRLMTGVCEQNGIKHLLVAHNMEDQAETFIMRLRHKSGLDGLASMAKERKLDADGSISVVRPLLGIAKQRLKDTLASMNQPWVEDPSNNNHKYERVRTRALLAQLQASEGISPEHFARAASGIGALRHILDRATGEFIDTHAHISEGGEVSCIKIPKKEFFSLDRQIMARALIMVIAKLGKDGYPPSGEKITRIVDWLLDDGGVHARTLGGCRISKNGHFLLIKPEPGRKKPTPPMVNNVTYQNLGQKTGEKIIPSLVAGH